MHITFPKDFLWGAATSGYQIEGAAEADGKGPSIWDRFTHTPGKILHGDTGDQACGTYDPKRLDADLDLMAALGLKAYIFSVQWPRIQPDGRGRGNQKGLDYYRRLVDGLNQRGITPALTVYHWELPQALQDKGGWLERDTVERFTDYAGILYEALGEHVPYWVTQNEPHTTAWLGYANGHHAPGLAEHSDAFVVTHHLLLSHGRAIQAARAGTPAKDKKFGAVIAHLGVYPATDSAADQAAAHREDGEQNRLFLEPMFLGQYPADIVKRYAKETKNFGFVKPGDLDVIHTPANFLGVNYYTSITVAAHEDDLRIESTGAAQTAMGWNIDPLGLHHALTRVRRDYTGNLPLFISENGASFRDYLDPEGRCHDTERVDFLREHMRQAHRAIEDGVPLKGYFVWSFMDNFEWDSGYRERFGLVYNEYSTQRRIPKDSYEWYRSVIQANGLDIKP